MYKNMHLINLRVCYYNDKVKSLYEKIGFKYSDEYTEYINRCGKY